MNDLSHLSHPEYLRACLLRCYEILDVFDAVWAERQQGVVTVEDRIAAWDARSSILRWIALYRGKLSMIARRGGHGHRVQGALSSFNDASRNHLCDASGKASPCGDPPRSPSSAPQAVRVGGERIPYPLAGTLGTPCGDRSPDETVKPCRLRRRLWRRRSRHGRRWTVEPRRIVTRHEMGCRGSPLRLWRMDAPLLC